MTNPSQLYRWRAVAEEAVRRGGAEIQSRFGQGGESTAKRGADLVTAADLATEAVILDLLRASEPDFGVISEEAGAENAAAEYVWLVDPLDGTNNFAIGLPYVAVAVSLLHYGSPVVAVTLDPLIGTLWSAVAGAGAWRNGEPIRVNPARPADRAVVAFVQGYSVPSEVGDSLRRAVEGPVKRVLTNWTPARDWCLLACGGIDAVISLDSEVEDQLGGALIAREAGARLADFAGNPAAPTAPRLLATASPELEQRLLRILGAVVR